MKNNSDGLVLLSTAIIILAGALSLGTGGLIEAISPHRGQRFEDAVNTVGYVLLTLGGICFIVTYLKYLRNKD